ncbi:MAG: hypothetical protein R2867_05180 [Caldilineaceae bacterium]
MKYLALLVFTSGAVTLGVELSASRLLEPVFGNNQIVWAALIGLILFYLALGAWLGGKLADRFPQQARLEQVVILGALGVALIPWPAAQFAVGRHGHRQFQWGFVGRFAAGDSPAF